MKTQELVDEIAKLTLVEASDLVKALEDKFGVSAAAMAVSAAPAAATAGSAPAADAPAAKSEFEIFLKDAGANKINVIKVVKEITGLGLGDAKAIVDGAPKTIKEKVPAEEAKKFEAQLKEAGATVELK
jgi:large subunit ribosomal protein L7/L12